VLEPNQPISQNFESLANLKAQLLDAIGNALPWVSSKFNARDDGSSVWDINPLDKTHTVGSVASFIGEELGLVCGQPNGETPRNGCEPQFAGKVLLSLLVFGEWFNRRRFGGFGQSRFDLGHPLAMWIILSVKPISILSQFISGAALRLAGSAVKLVVMLQTQINQISKSKVGRVGIQVRNLPLACRISIV
jgi:hypothetical protein